MLSLGYVAIRILTMDSHKRQSTVILRWLDMFRNLLSSVWRFLPAKIRRWSVRATNVKFTVTAAGIILDREGRVLLIKHRFRPGSGWGIPGGFLQAGEEPVDALRREMREEIGLELDQPRIFAVRTFARHSQLEVVFVVNGLGELKPKSIEVERVAWFKPDSLPDQLPSDQKKLIRSVLHDGAKGPD